MTLLSPVLRQMDARAAGPVSPRRLILIFSPNGPMEQLGPASGSETNFTIHDWWKPLERHKADGIFLSHMAATGKEVVNGDGHPLGGQMYSGFGGGLPGDAYAMRGETIDNIIGRQLVAENRAGLVRSVIWGNADGGTGEAFSVGPGHGISPQKDPSQAWAQLFSKFTAPVSTPEEVKRAAALLARNKSVLDFVAKDCSALRDALGREGKALLDDHCSTVRSIEKNLGSTLPMSCVKPGDPGAKAWTNEANIDAQTAAFIELIGASLACELTSVVGYQFGGQSARNQLAASYGVPNSPTADSGDSGPVHHAWTHQYAGGDGQRAKALGTFTTFYASQVALLVDKLKKTTDANGKPLLDSTMVLWVSELGGRPENAGQPHTTGYLPAVLFGSGQGTFKTGRYVRGKSPDDKEAGRDMAKLLVSMMQYMGLKNDTVGATGVKGPLLSLYA